MSKKPTSFDIMEGKPVKSIFSNDGDHFRALIENSNDIFSLLDATGTIIYTSPSISRVLGFNDQERVGHNIFENIHPEDIPRLKKVFTRLVNEPGLVVNETTRYMHKNGEWLWVEGYAKNLLDNSAVRAVVVNFRDITESKQIEQSLHKLSHELNERVKELNCINQITGILNQVELNLEEKLSKIVNILPPAFQYPEVAAVRIKMDGQEYKTANFRKTSWIMSLDIPVYGKAAGSMEVCYLKKMPETENEIFLKEERNLLDDIVLDIGYLLERQQALAALQESEQKYRALIETANTGYLVIDGEGRVLVANQEYVRLSGHKEVEEILGRKVTEWTAKHDLERNAEEVKKCKELGYVRNLEIDYVDRQGKITAIEINATVIQTESEPQILSICRDITERKHSQELLRESEERLRLALKASQMGTFDWDMPNNHITWSRWHEELWGYAPGEFDGTYKAFEKRVHPEDLPGINAEVQRCIDSRESFVREFRVVWPDSSVHWITARGEFTFDEPGQPVRMRGMVIETTDRKLTESALRQESEFSNALLNSLPGVVYCYDENLKFLRWNRNLEDVLGYTSDEISRMSPLEFFDGTDRELIADRMREVFEKGVSEAEADFLTKSGKKIPYYFTGISTDIGGKKCLVGVGIDITQRRLSEEKLKENTYRLQQAERHAQLGSWEFDVRTGKGWWSDSLYQMLGFEVRDEIPELNEYLEHIHPDDRKKLRIAFLRMKQGKEPEPSDYRSNPALGPMRYFTPTLHIEKDSEGKILKYIGTVLDITKLKQIDEELHVREAQLSNALKIARAGHWEYDVATDTFTFNDLFYAIFRTTAEKEGGYTMSSAEYARRFVHPEDLEVVGREVQAAIESTDPDFTHELEHRVIFANDETGYIAVRIFTVKDKTGRTVKTYGVNQDITKRKQSEQNLALLDFALNHVSEAAYLMDKESRLLNVNEEACRSLGYTREELLTMKVTDIDPSFSMEDWYKHWDKLMMDGSVTIETICQRKDGVIFPVEVNTNYFEYDGNGYNMALARDITERKKSDAALKESEERFRLMADSAPVLIWMTDTEGNCIYFNQGWLDYTGKSLEQEQGSGWMVGLHPDDKQNFMNTFSSALKQRKSYTFEKRLQRSDGEYRCFLDTGIPRYTSDGVFAGYIGTCIDITEIKQAETAVRESEWRFRIVARATSDIIWDWDLKTNSVWWNEGIQTQFGYSPDDIEPGSESWTNRIHPDDVDQIVNGIHAVINSKEDNWSDEYRFRRKDGSYAYIYDRGFVVRNENGEALRMIGGMTDITERKSAEDKVLRLNRVYKMLSEINSLIVHVHDKQQLFDEACRIAVEEGEFLLSWVGVIDEDLKQIKPVAFSGINDGYLDEINISLDFNNPRGRGPTGRAIHDNRPFIINDIATDPNMKIWREKALARNFRSSVAIPLSVSGEVVGALNLYAREMGFFDEDEMKLLTELAGDISYAFQNIIQREKLDYISSYDPLTGLPNRTLFLDHFNSVLGRAIKGKKKVALLVCDIKQFRHINNVYGPQTGDSILKEVARRLRDHTADPVNIGRITSDYFVMILHDVRDVTGIAYMFENYLFPALSEPYLVNNHEIQINFNGGIAVFPSDGNDAEIIYRNAEAALKRAKLTGEKYLFYQPEMTAHIIETLQIESKLRTALKEEQFVLHYQPKINSLTHQIIGLEALIRWNDPDTGLVPPGKFIPILEETGLILDVGLWALDRAASDYRKWLKQLKSVPRIAVNVSSVQLKQKDFVEQLEKAIRHSGKAIPMEIEITESLIMTDIEQNIAKLKAIQLAGLKVAIDDFGTGYSSLSYISKLPINSLKIDRSFIMNMTTQPESMTIVSTIITLAHALNFKVVAEGVETEEQSRFLTLLKCDEMQGFLFSKPLPPDDVYELLRSGKTL